MLLPLVAFVLGCIVFTILGLILLSYVPSLRLTLPNLVVFVAGAFVAAPAFLLIYGKIFARNQLSDAAFVGISRFCCSEEHLAVRCWFGSSCDSLRGNLSSRPLVPRTETEEQDLRSHEGAPHQFHHLYWRAALRWSVSCRNSAKHAGTAKWSFEVSETRAGRSVP